MIASRPEFIQLLKDFGENGATVESLREQGVPSPQAAAAELRRKGHEVDVVQTGGGIRIVYRNPPIVGARRRLEQQTSFDTTSRPRGAYEEEA